MNYNEKKDQANEISVVSYLESVGVLPVKETGVYFYYNSPLPGRFESSPSFCVRKTDNRWRDFGMSTSWDRVTELVKQLESCSLPEAIDILLHGGSKPIEYKKKEVDNTPGIEILDSSNMDNPSLISYFCSREINIEVAIKYCKEVIVKFPKGKNPYMAYPMIGFRNDLGGYELRNSFFKLSSQPKHFTKIGSGGDRYIFEGFFDFLSYLTWKDILSIEGTAIILNSITLLPLTFKYLKEEGANYCFLDNDKAGDKALETLSLEGIEHKDCSNEYLMYNDLNSMLTNTLIF